MANYRLERPYVVVDVFTKTQFGGNQLAVITDARGLTTVEMQRIAAEFNFAETSFVLPPVDPENTAQVRIFTRAQEVPFAGHPNVGTAFVIARERILVGAFEDGCMRFEEAAGLVEVRLVRDETGVQGATITAPRKLEVGALIDPAVMARCVGLDEDAILLDHHKPQSASVGLPFFIAELDLTSLSRAHAVLGAFSEAGIGQGYADASGRFSAFVYARLGEGHDRLRARMFAPLSGNFEDPATGSASAALGAYLAKLNPAPDGDFRIEIEQGVEMGRPSEITLDLRKSGGEVRDVKVTGLCVQVMRGVLTID
ncbi:PhzF family phenazine biosynthesis protein [Pelagibius sp. Alg239-R121]|uniref:PhzF family phenazine biosynthesis protein n=1 Tax=Pelagibius sp. Alg239-R121 TaxID=2993448 RepID=UPI0024A77CB9|nr:PhzF family phenazine biosynthesis protein [Pelagibius sp. Alg239-R121]